MVPVEWEARGMSITDTYEVEDIGTETVWVRCRRCGRMWGVFDEAQRGWWRCPWEPHDRNEQKCERLDTAHCQP